MSRRRSALRILAGVAKGRPLVVGQDEGLRPTSSRVREAIFSILQAEIEGAHVLDLFAGSGALGLEALSRGAHSCTLVEVDDQRCQVLTRNAASVLADESRARVVLGDARAPRSLLGAGAFDVVLMDPPYRRGLVAPTLLDLACGAMLADDGVVVVVHEVGWESVEVVGWSQQRSRRYGDSGVTFYRCPGSGASGPRE